jgi:hypothetical protein
MPLLDYNQHWARNITAYLSPFQTLESFSQCPQRKHYKSLKAGREWGGPAPSTPDPCFFGILGEVAFDLGLRYK